jgi:hypothetical protein
MQIFSENTQGWISPSFAKALVRLYGEELATAVFCHGSVRMYNAYQYSPLSGAPVFVIMDFFDGVGFNDIAAAGDAMLHLSVVRDQVIKKLTPAVSLSIGLLLFGKVANRMIADAKFTVAKNYIPVFRRLLTGDAFATEQDILRAMPA